MADISKLKLPNGSEYNLKDNNAIHIDPKGYDTKYINIHPENSPVLIPFMHNDIAFLLKRGGSAVIKADDTIVTPDINNVFDGSGSYFAINPSTYISGGCTTFTIELTCHKTFTWSNTIYVDFGSAGWRAKNVTIEVMHSNYSGDAWTQKGLWTNNGNGHCYVNCSHVPVGASNAGAGFNKIRFTFSGWATSTIFRIACLGVYNYGSSGLRETFIPQDGSNNIYGNLIPYVNSSKDLGSASKYWKNGYFTNINGVAVGSSPKFTDTTYTPASANPLMDGTVAVGTSVKYAREDHRHPTDTSRASANHIVFSKTQPLNQ